MNYIREYYQQIQDGLVVSKKIKRTYKHLVEDILDNEDSDYYFNEVKSDKAIQFIEKYCKHSKGKMGGKPFILSLWQKALVSAMFGILSKENDLRKYKRVVLIVGRKNGKSTLASAIGLYLMVGDGEAGAEIYSVATKRDQAKIIWNESKKMIQKSPSLRKRIKTRVGDIVSDFNDSSYKPLGRDSETLDGLNIHGALMDEIHAWNDMNMYDVIVDGTASREQPMIFITTTAGTVRESVYDRIYDDAKQTISNYDLGNYDETSLFLVYEIDNKNEWRHEKNWAKANPELDNAKNRQTLKEKVDKAKSDIKLVKNLITKDFNIAETQGTAWLSLSDLRNEEMFVLEELKPSYALGGFDLSQTTDLTCATLIFRVKESDKIYVEQMYFLPSSLLLDKTTYDGVPYDIWHEQGWLRVSGDNAIDYKDISKWFLEMYQQKGLIPFKIGYDSWSARYLVDEMVSMFGESTLEKVIQGKQTLSSPMYKLEADLKAKKVIYNKNPILEWCLSNVAIDIDRNGNIQPIKQKQTKLRIDGVASLLNAYVELERWQGDYLSMVG